MDKKSERAFLSEYHKRAYLAAKEEIEEMSKRPLSREDMVAQIRRNHLQSTRNKIKNTDL